MNTAVARLTTVGPRAGAVRLVAVGAAGVGWFATGLLAAVPAGAGLALMAASDLATQRFSLRALGTASVFVAAVLLVDCVERGAWGRLGMTVIGTAAAASLLLAAWLCSTGIAFGDVLLVTFAVTVPLFVSALATLVFVAAALLASAAFVGWRAVRLGAHRPATMPLAPALLIGWLCGVVVG